MFFGAGNEPRRNRKPPTMYEFEFELTGYEEHMRDSEGCGDARVCPIHPHVKTSSDNGMFDAPCDECEHAMDERDAMEAAAEDLRRYPGGRCVDPSHWFQRGACETSEDQIPF